MSGCVSVRVCEWVCVAGLAAVWNCVNKEYDVSPSMYVSGCGCVCTCVCVCVSNVAINAVCVFVIDCNLKLIGVTISCIINTINHHVVQ